MKKIKPKSYAILLQKSHGVNKWDAIIQPGAVFAIVLSLKPVPGTTMTQVTLYPWNPYNGRLRFLWLKLRVFFGWI